MLNSSDMLKELNEELLANEKKDNENNKVRKEMTIDEENILEK
mgnify:CR=1 FL=1